LRRDRSLRGEDTYLAGRTRGRRRAGRRRVRIGAPDASLTTVSGMAAVSELCDRLGVVAALNRAVGSIKVRARGHSAGGLLVGLASAQLAGRDHLVGLDRVCVDVAGQALVPVEVYGRKKRGVANNYQSQRCGRPHVPVGVQ
jgi:hypothetical protein